MLTSHYKRVRTTSMKSKEPIPLSIALEDAAGLRESLTGQLAAAIRSGRLRAGLKLPATRQMAQTARVSRNTVLAAYEALVAQGLAVARRGSGTYVADSGRVSRRAEVAQSVTTDRRINPIYHSRRAVPPSSVPPGTHDFRIGIPDWRYFPVDLWRRLTSKALRETRPSNANYLGSSGPLSLREAIAQQVSRTRAISCDPEDIIVTAGAQQAFDLISRVVVTRAGVNVAVEDPGYANTREAFVAAGAGIVPVRVDEDGMLIREIPETARVVSLTPSHQYPLGAQLSAERRSELLTFARRNDAVIVEDDYDGEFRFRGRSLEALKTLDDDDRVFYVGTFSKTLMPSLRLGYIISPAWARDALAFAKHCADLHSTTLPQRVLTTFIAEGHMARHLTKMRGLYQRRCERLVQSLNQHCQGLMTPFAPAAGLHLIALLHEPSDDLSLPKDCAAEGVAISDLQDCWVHRPRWPMIGLGFGGIEDVDIDAGVQRLKQVLLRRLSR